MRGFALLAALLAGCTGAVRTGPDPGPAPLSVGAKAVLHVAGSGDGQVFAEGLGTTIPLTSFVKWEGKATVTIRVSAPPVPPFLIIDGDAGLIVTPAPGLEVEALRAVSAGAILIRRDGVPGMLNPGQ